MAYVEQQGSGQWQHYMNVDFCVEAGANPGHSLLSGSLGTRWLTYAERRKVGTRE
jgi:hypothetical protein